MKKLFIVIFLVSSLLINAQDNNEDQKFGITFSGFVKTDIIRDSRQSSASNGLREGHFYLYPDSPIYDTAGNDINENPSFHILSIQTRVKGDITGPDAFGAKTSGGIEAEFFGTNEVDINGFRLRHAWVKLDWSNTALMIGQNWHPMFPVESYPGTLSFNTGAPFTPFSRNPQVRLTRKVYDISLSLTAYAQRDFSSSCTAGVSNKYLRNSGLPGFDLQIRVPGGAVVTGWAGINYKKLRPELITTANYETDATIGSFSTYANMKFKTSPVNVSVMGVIARNASDLVMIGGYAVTSTDPVTEAKTYTNLKTASLWADLTSNGSGVVFGFFTGFTKNLGAQDDISGDVYGRGSDIDHVFRVSPRVLVTEGRLTFAAEIENTTVAYGTMQTNGRIANMNNVSNFRILISTIYKF